MGVTATGARAGVWTPDAGSAYQRLAFNFFRNDASFSAGPDRREGFKEFTNTNLTYYLEDGIRDRLAFFGSLPAERLTHRTKGRNEVETFGLWRRESRAPLPPVEPRRCLLDAVPLQGTLPLRSQGPSPTRQPAGRLPPSARERPHPRRHAGRRPCGGDDLPSLRSPWWADSASGRSPRPSTPIRRRPGW